MASVLAEARGRLLSLHGLTHRARKLEAGTGCANGMNTGGGPGEAVQTPLTVPLTF